MKEFYEPIEVKIPICCDLVSKPTNNIHIEEDNKSFPIFTESICVNCGRKFKLGIGAIKYVVEFK